MSGVVVVRCVMGPHLLSPPPLVEWSGGIGKAGHVLVISSLCNGMFGGVSSMGNAYSIQTWCARPLGHGGC
jgi:hypothetical protein